MSSFVVSARKYRPTTFQSVVGQKSLTTTLKNAIKSQKLAHAYLFCGPRGVGKTSCARIFAKTINCLNLSADYDACNACESCKAFNEQRSFNIHELDAASNNGVDEIRTLNEQVRIAPQIGKYSVYIIDEVHMLSSSAFNAFLKTLEEPPAHAIFILATTEKHKIIPTILSRCQIYDFNRITIADTVAHLKYIATQEQVEVDENALNIIAQKSDGAMRDALSIFDQLVSFTGNNISYQATIDNLNVLDYEYYFRLVDALLQEEVSQPLLILDEVLNKGFDAQHFIGGLSTHLRDVLVCKDPTTIPLLEVGADIGEKYKKQAEKTPLHFIFRALEISSTCELNYRQSKDKRLLIEIALIKIAQIGVDKKKNSSDTAPIIKKIETQSDKNITTASPQKESNNDNTTTTAQTPVQADSKADDNPKPPTRREQPPTSFAKPISISITAKAPLADTAKKEEEEKKTASNAPAIALDIEKTKELWKKYIETENTDMVKKVFLENHYPERIEEGQIVVCVDNKFQEKELLNMDIISFLRKELGNPTIRFKITVTDKEHIKKRLTSQDIYNHMVTINPLLEQLVTDLNLQID